jgi:hypothetical protein
VEVQNTASLARPTSKFDALLPEVRGLDPDVVLLTIAPFDLLDLTKSTPPAVVDAPIVAPAPTPPSHSAKLLELLAKVRQASRESRALIVAQHYMLRSDASLYRAYQLGQEDDVLRVPLSPTNRDRYALLDSELADMSKQLGAYKVPLVVGAIPNRIQAALLSNHVKLPNTDPGAFARTVDSLSAKDGFLTADITSEFANAPHAESLYYVVDGHPNAGANALIADALEQTLLKQVPAFSTCGSRP